MMTCPTCGTDNPSTAPACATCGAPLAGREAGSHALPPGSRLMEGAYAIGRVLGQGGFGITYQGSETSPRRPAAIKEFFPHGSTRAGTEVQPPAGMTAAQFAEARDRFLEESRILQRFRHPGIVGVSATFGENGTAYMVMELLRGKPLGQFLDTHAALTEAEAVALVRKAGEALAEVHEAGLLHRDIKPDNLILTEDGRVVLIDFGTAREFAAERTHRMTAMLTPGYAPLEQYSQQGRFGPYTDVYALAATLYHLLTGRMPTAALDRIQGVELPPPRQLNPAVSQAVSDAVMWALEIQVKNRPQTVRQFLAALAGAPAPRPAAPTPRPVAAVPKPAPPKPPPFTPFRFRQGTAKNAGELAELCDQFPGEAGGYVVDGAIERWLAADLRQPALAGRVKGIAASHRAERRQAVELVVRELHRAAGHDRLPKLVVEPPELDLGSVPLGGAASGTVTLHVTGRGEAWGKAVLHPPLAGVSVTPGWDTTKRQSILEVRLDALRIAPGSYSAQVLVTAEGLPGSLVVPLRFRVAPVEVRFEPKELDLGRVPRGSRVAKVLELTVPPESRIVGTASFAEPPPGLAITRHVEGTAPKLEVSVDTTALAPGKRYETEAVVLTNAGRLTIPVRFQVAPQWGQVATSAVQGTLTAALLLFLTRTAVGAVFGREWLSVPPSGTLYPLVAAGVGLLGAAALRGALRAARGTPEQPQSGGCLRAAGKVAGFLAVVALSPLLGQGWLIGTESVLHALVGAALDPPTAWAAAGAAFGLLHGAGAGMVRAGEPRVGRALALLAVLALIGCLGYGWYVSPPVLPLPRLR